MVAFSDDRFDDVVFRVLSLLVEDAWGDGLERALSEDSLLADAHGASLLVIDPARLVVLLG